MYDAIVKTHNTEPSIELVLHTSTLQTLLLCALLRHGIAPADSFLSDSSIYVCL